MTATRRPTKGGTKKVKISKRLDNAKIADLVRCIAKGKLTITVPVSTVRPGKAQAAYEWD